MADLCRKHEISEAMFYKRKAKYGVCSSYFVGMESRTVPIASTGSIARKVFLSANVKPAACCRHACADPVKR